MRIELKDIDRVRDRFTGMFSRYGTKPGWNGRIERTILLKDIQDRNGKIVSDHVWFRMTKGFASLGELVEGARVTFDARVRPYQKGYVNWREGIDDRRMDYRLSHPTKIVVVDSERNGGS